MQVCLNSCPGREGLSQVSGWLMAGRLASVELFCCRLDQDSPAGSERLLIHSLAPDTFRSVTTICRRRIKTEEKAKDDQDNLKKGIEFILFFISSWCNSSYSSNHPGVKYLVQQGIKINSAPQATATTFTFSSFFILHLCTKFLTIPGRSHFLRCPG